MFCFIDLPPLSCRSTTNHDRHLNYLPAISYSGLELARPSVSSHSNKLAVFFVWIGNKDKTEGESSTSETGWLCYRVSLRIRQLFLMHPDSPSCLIISWNHANTSVGRTTGRHSVLSSKKI
jgi:hypothetical protein